LENVGYHGTSLFNAEEYLGFVKKFAPAGYLIDLGHAHLNGWNPAALLEQPGPLLTGIHLRDNHGDDDRHLPVGEGNIPWPDLWPLLGSLADHRPLILEYAPGTPLTTLVAGCRLTERETQR